MDQEILRVPMTLLKDYPKEESKLLNPDKAVAYLVNHTPENTMMRFRFDQKEKLLLSGMLAGG